ncbi:TlpA disulfide reductase family protein [Mesorhizobium sp. ORM8.1]
MLRIESPAPAIKVNDWLRGKPLATFQPGMVYLVEFWATGCGPCVAAMPLLMQLQEKYQDSGFEVVGVAASEEGPTAAETRTSLMLGCFRGSPISIIGSRSITQAK